MIRGQCFAKPRQCFAKQRKCFATSKNGKLGIRCRGFKSGMQSSRTATWDPALSTSVHPPKPGGTLAALDQHFLFRSVASSAVRVSTRCNRGSTRHNVPLRSSKLARGNGLIADAGFRERLCSERADQHRRRSSKALATQFASGVDDLAFPQKIQVALIVLIDLPTACRARRGGRESNQHNATGICTRDVNFSHFRDRERSSDGDETCQRAICDTEGQRWTRIARCCSWCWPLHY